MKKLVCYFCLEEFESSRRKKYCSSECRIEAQKGKVMPLRQKVMPKYSIAQIAKMANEAGMSYGEYVAEHKLA